MDGEAAGTKPHVLVIPFPAQGHINPAFFLASKALPITFVTTTAATKSANLSDCSSVTIATISDGFEQVKEPETVEGFFKRFKAVLSRNLAKFVDERRSSGCSDIVIIIYDSIMPWVLETAHERGLLGASFFTQSCAVGAIFYHLKH